MGFRILITECASPLGAALLRGFESYAFSIICPPRDSVDWCDAAQVAELMETARPAIVINTLQLADTALRCPEYYLVLADVCKVADLTLVHISSHDVLGAAQQQTGAVLEHQLPEPDHAVGVASYSAEQAFMAVRRCLILRLSWIVDAPDGMLEQVCRGLVVDHGLSVSDVWRGCPTGTEDVVRAVIAMVQQILCGAENWGVFHFHTSDACSEAEFADFVSRVLGKAGCQTSAITVVGQENRLIASNGWLSGRRCTDCFGIQLRSWRQSIKSKVLVWLQREIDAGRVKTSSPPDASDHCSSSTQSGA